MASRRIKKKKLQEVELKKLRKIAKVKDKIQGDKKHQVEELKAMIGINSNTNFMQSVKKFQSISKEEYEDISDKNKASSIGNYYKHDLIERYHDLVDLGYIVPVLNEQEVYDYAPTMLEEELDSDVIGRMVEEGERKRWEVMAKNAEKRKQEIRKIDF